MNGISGLRWQRFPKETLRRLFDAVDTDDVVDAHVELPDPIVLACPDEWIERCYALCLQFWEDGVKRGEMLLLVEKLLRNEGLSADERIQYKNIRARYKHLRFAQRLYGKRHRSGFVFDLTTRVMGHLQDAFRGGKRGAVVRHGLKLKLLLSRPVWRMVRRGLIDIELDNEAGFVGHQRAELGRLKKVMGRTMFAGHQFHTVRKIVSMQVSYYDTVRSIEPNEHAFRMSRFLAAINGLMGARHDEMVADSFSGRRNYRTPTPLATQTRTRLESLVAHYPL
ncbi:MAG: hypothetical protein WBW32_13970 [Luteibacter sp.]